MSDQGKSSYTTAGFSVARFVVANWKPDGTVVDVVDLLCCLEGSTERRELAVVAFLGRGSCLSDAVSGAVGGMVDLFRLRLLVAKENSFGSVRFVLRRNMRIRNA